MDSTSQTADQSIDASIDIIPDTDCYIVSIYDITPAIIYVNVVIPASQRLINSSRNPQ